MNEFDKKRDLIAKIGATIGVNLLEKINISDANIPAFMAGMVKRILDNIDSSTIYDIIYTKVDDVVIDGIYEYLQQVITNEHNAEFRE